MVTLKKHIRKLAVSYSSGWAASKHSTDSGSGKAKEDNGRRRLKFAELKIYGFEAIALLNPAAIKNVFSTNLVKEQAVVPKETTRNITMASGAHQPVVRVLKIVPATFGQSTVPLDFLVIDRPPFDVIIGDPSLEDMKGLLDLGRREPHFKIDGAEAVVTIAPNSHWQNTRRSSSRAPSRIIPRPHEVYLLS